MKNHIISGTVDYGLWYLFDHFLVILRYPNVNWTENVDDTKDTFGHYFFIGHYLVDWISKKWNCIPYP